MNRSSLLFCVLIAFTSNIHAQSPDAPPSGIHEEHFVEIGGIEQWVTIHGDRRDLPVVLFVHGGPGNPMSLLAESVYPGWEEEFIVVHYDQRGAGKTYERNLPVEELSLELLAANELTLELLVQDGVEAAEYLCELLGRDRIILTGTSWGSALAVNIYQARPDLFSGYVGLSQMVSFQSTLATSYDAALGVAAQKDDPVALETLREIGPPPWSNPRNPGRLRRIVRQYESEITEPLPPLVWGAQYDTPEYRAAYFAGEEFSWVKFVGLNGEGFANDVDLLANGLEFDVPVILIQGTEDLFTTPEVSKDYFDKILAPSKDYRLIPSAGHDPNEAMIDAQRHAIREIRAAE